MTADRPSAGRRLGLPGPVRACLFDMDGVLTQTAAVHCAAWAEMFDAFLRGWAARHGERFVAFDPGRDYRTFVDGKPRAAGVRDFLASRGIALPEGTAQDPAQADTVQGLGGRKNDLLLARIARDGVQTFPGSIGYVRAVRAAGLRTAVVSASANTRAVLAATGIEELFDVRVDAAVAERRGLAGKPAPDTFLAAAQDLGVPPARAAVFEDALSGVAAGRAGQFALVVGVDRVGQGEALRAAGADLVVTDLGDLLADT